MSGGNGRGASIRKGRRIEGFFAVVVGAAIAVYLLQRTVDRGVLGGIVGLEFVGTADGAARLIGDGSQPVTEAELAIVRQALRMDFLFLLLYSLALYLATRLVWPLYRLAILRTNGKTAALAALTPGILDALENGMLLIGTMPQQWRSGWFVLATAFASAKSLLLILIIAMLIGAVASGVRTPSWLYDRMRQRTVEERPPSEGKPTAPPRMATRKGIALSGGGVRAASVSLGALQELERGRASGDGIGWDWATGVTAVSGGAYMGGAWQLARDYGGCADAWALSGSSPGPEEEHLLDNLGYLTAAMPRGRPADPGASASLGAVPTQVLGRTRNRPAAWATILTGFLVNVAVITAALFIVTVPLGLVFKWLAGLGGSCAGRTSGQASVCLLSQPRMWGPPVLWIGAGLASSLLWVIVGKLTGRGTRLIGFLKILVLGSLAVGSILTVLLVGLPVVIVLIDRVGSPAAAIAGVVAGLGTIAAVVRILRKFLTTIAAKLAGIAFTALLIISSGAIARSVWLTWTFAVSRNWWIGSTLFVSLTWLVASPDLWSMFAFYRGKLRAAYALRRDGAVARPFVNDRDKDEANGDLPEPALGYDSKLTICASAHATTRGVRTHYGIPAMSFTFRDHKIEMFIPRNDQGQYDTYSCSIDQMSRAYPGAGLGTTRRITTMFAVALSGAALAPAMGRFRIGPTSMLIAFANVRLGTWMPNPRYVAIGTEHSDQGNRFPVVRLGYLFKEFLSLHDPTDPFVYVSDGGHWENTGLVELLRSDMPNEAILIDADAGRAESIRQLSQAIDLAKLECNVDIYINLEPLRGVSGGAGEPVFASRSVALGLMHQAGKQDEHWGVLWYAKPILTASTPAPLLAHREVDAEFPATTTLNQFFDTSTYTAYRDLGRYNAAEIKTARGKLMAMFSDHPTAEDCMKIEDWDNQHWVVHEFHHLLAQQEGGVGEDTPRHRMYAAIRTTLAGEEAELPSSGGSADRVDLSAGRAGPTLAERLTKLRSAVGAIREAFS